MKNNSFGNVKVTIGGTELVKAAFLKAVPEFITLNLRILTARCGFIPHAFSLFGVLGI